jgi:hypothetical protein
MNCVMIFVEEIIYADEPVIKVTAHHYHYRQPCLQHNLSESLCMVHSELQVRLYILSSYEMSVINLKSHFSIGEVFSGSCCINTKREEGMENNSAIRFDNTSNTIHFYEITPARL